MNKERARELASEWNRRFHEGDIMLSDAIEQAIVAACAEQKEFDADICDQHASIEGIAQKCAAAIRNGE